MDKLTELLRELRNARNSSMEAHMNEYSIASCDRARERYQAAKQNLEAYFSGLTEHDVKLGTYQGR